MDLFSTSPHNIRYESVIDLELHHVRYWTLLETSLESLQLVLNRA
jgi:hypothetical protein